MTGTSPEIPASLGAEFLSPTKAVSPPPFAPDRDPIPFTPDPLARQIDTAVSMHFSDLVQACIHKTVETAFRLRFSGGATVSASGGNPFGQVLFTVSARGRMKGSLPIAERACEGTDERPRRFSLLVSQNPSWRRV